MGIQVTAEQIAILGFMALLIVQGIKLWVATTGKEVSTPVLTWGLFGLSLVLAFFWAAPNMPALPVLTGDPGGIVGALLGYAATLVGVASAIAGFATLVYNVLLKAVFDGLGLTSRKIANQAYK
jgi:hypothetical protein